jgi:hypothetical protein
VRIPPCSTLPPQVNKTFFSSEVISSISRTATAYMHHYKVVENLCSTLSTWHVMCECAWMCVHLVMRLLVCAHAHEYDPLRTPDTNALPSFALGMQAMSAIVRRTSPLWGGGGFPFC